MKKHILLLMTLISVLGLLFTGCGKKEPEDYVAASQQLSAPKEGDLCAEFIIEDYGSIFVKLFPEQAPKAVENFTTHAKDGYYDGVKFHRVMADFMIQGGDPEGTGYGGESIWGKPFEDEFTESLAPFRGALCMANAGANTNGSQFFLVQADNASLQKLKEMVEYKGYSLKDYFNSAYGTNLPVEKIEEYMEYGGTPWLYGHHTVFGQIYKGFELLDKISAVETNSKDAPLVDVIIKNIRIYNYGGQDGV